LHYFKQANYDHSLFLKHVRPKTTTHLIYVDDNILTRNDIDKIHNITSSLDQNFKIKDLGDLTYFLSFEVAISERGIQLCERKYSICILRDVGILASAPVSTPINFSKRTISTDVELLMGSISYRKLISRLIHLTNTRLDISHVVHNLSRFVVAPTMIHHQASLYILRYLK